MGKGKAGAGVRACACVCALGLTATMSDVAPSKDAFVALMAAAKDPWYTAVIYRAWLEHVDPEEPLWRTPYFGQVVRQGTKDAILKERKREHETKAAHEDKDLGFHAVIDMYGSGAIKWEIVGFKSGPLIAMQAWANAEEKRLIAENGGVLRHMDTKLKQTLNLTKGGQGNPAAWWAGICARRRCALNKFKAAMEALVEEHGSALVPQAFVTADGYKLGVALGGFRRGQMRKGMPDEAAIVAWAQALPKWAWDARDTDEYRKAHVEHHKKRSQSAFARFKSAMEAYVEEHGSALVSGAFVTADGYKLGRLLQYFRKRRKLKTSVEKDWAEALPKWAWDVTETDEYHEDRAQRLRNMVENETSKKKVNRQTKRKATMATEASKDKRSKSATVQRTSERRAELVRARLIAVPFEKSNKRRVEMHAASTNFSGKKGNQVLYMISEDGKTIRSVAKNGSMGNRFIVGPVVDPPPPDVYDSD
jgi:hypothetical protein